MLIGAVALIMGAPSTANAQCWGTLNAITSVVGTINTVFLPGGSAFLSSAPNNASDQQGSGVWSRAVGGTATTQNNTNLNLSLTLATPGLPTTTVPLSQSCRPSIKQDFAGFDAGADIAAAANGDWHFGVLAGYVGARASAGGQPNTMPLQNSGAFEAPSAGLYAGFSRGNFSADVQGRMYDIQAEDLGQRLDARGFSFTGNLAYRFDLPGNWAIEPSVGAVYSRTSFDQQNLGGVTQTLGSLATSANNALGRTLVSPSAVAALSGTLQINDVESLLGRASVKVSTSLPVTDQIVAYPFLTASVFHEFEGNVSSSLAISGTVPTVLGNSAFQGNGSFSASGIGTYGQFGIGSAFQLADSGWLSYARFDYRIGDNIEGYGGSVGLRYQFDDTRHATDNRAHLPVKAVPKAAGYDWTGLYAGLSAASTSGHTHWASDVGGVDPDFAGFLGGGQIGYNYQTGQFVWGIEADAGAANAQGSAPCPIKPLLYSCHDNVDALGSVAARFGYAWGRALFYAKGGWAFADVTAGTSLNFVDPGLPRNLATVGAPTHSTNVENGWTAGVGMEFALTDRWSVKAEYMHYGLPQYAFMVAQHAMANASTGGDTVRIGLNYHFWPPR